MHDDYVRAVRKTGRWEMLGWQTVVQTIAEIRDALTGSGDAGKSGFTLGPKPTPVTPVAGKKAGDKNVAARG